MNDDDKKVVERVNKEYTKEEIKRVKKALLDNNEAGIYNLLFGEQE